MEADPQSRIERALLAKDYAAVRQLLRNRPAPALAEVIRALPIEQQVVVFRILPRHLAGRAFEFLDLSHQTPLLKAMGQEEVAAVLDHMAPDDRTMLFEELQRPSPSA